MSGHIILLCTHGAMFMSGHIILLCTHGASRYSTHTYTMSRTSSGLMRIGGMAIVSVMWVAPPENPSVSDAAVRVTDVGRAATNESLIAAGPR